MPEGYDAAVAATYEDDPEHRITPAEAAAWREALAALSLPAGASALDIGAGTGQLLRLLLDRGLAARGLEPAPAMIEAAVAGGLSRDAFIRAAADDPDAVAPDSLALIASRQVLCHLTDPLGSFRLWRRWLAPGGAVLLVDGCWAFEGAAEDDLARHPLARVEGADPGAALLRAAGFDLLRAGPFGTPDGRARRYVLIARKPPR